MINKLDNSLIIWRIFKKFSGKISSGKNMLFASDDPIGAVELSGLNDVTTRIDQ